MVKIGKSEKELEGLADIYYKKVLAKFNLKERLQIKIDEVTNNNLADETAFYLAIQCNLREIIIGKPLELEGISSSISTLYTSLENYRLSLLPLPKSKTDKSNIKKQLREEFFLLFDYSSFTTENDSNWAYDYVSALGLSVCPYCNNQYTFTIKTKNGKTRPQFDHFFKKSKYPYFAISFYNLIPSCYVCNANLKGQKDFKPSTHIHPFIEGIEDTLVFTTKINSVDYLLGQKDFEVCLKPVDSCDKKKLERANQSSNVFHIKDQYRFHKKYAGEIICKKYIYTDSKIDELMKDFDSGSFSLFSSREELKEMLFGNYLREDKLHERPLAKLTKNIVDE